MKYVLVSGGEFLFYSPTFVSRIDVAWKSNGLNVSSIKIDPYMNIDGGTMAPTESVTLIVFLSRGHRLT